MPDRNTNILGEAATISALGGKALALVPQCQLSERMPQRFLPELCFSASMLQGIGVAAVIFFRIYYEYGSLICTSRNVDFFACGGSLF